MDLSNFILTPATLALIILGMVELVKKLGVRGNKLMLISMAIGVALAFIYQGRELYLPAQPYIDVLFFGLAAGLGASGIYSFINQRFPVQQQPSISTTRTWREFPAERDDLQPCQKNQP